METTSRLQRESTGEWIVVARDREIAAGGQSRVYPVEGRAEWVAKLYVAPAEEQARKLAVMLARTPGTGEAKGVRLVWPFDVLRDSDHQLAGLLVPRVAGSHRIFELYNPATRRRVAPLFHWGLLHRTALRLARAFGALHEAGYVVGDVNESNILVDERGDVAVIDTDSFQVPDPDGGAVHLCPVGRPEFTPPELQGRLFPELVRSELHDRFGLGVLLFQTLMEGTHPFAGRWWGPGEPPPLAARIAAGAYPYDEAGRREALPPRTAPAIGILHPALQALFRRCFVEGHADPGARPSPAEWADALEEAAADLVECRRNASHLHASHLPECPWCARTRLLRGRDPFPAARAVARGAHLPAPRAPARWRGGAAARVPAPASLYDGSSGTPGSGARSSSPAGCSFRSWSVPSCPGPFPSRCWRSAGGAR